MSHDGCLHRQSKYPVYACAQFYDYLFKLGLIIIYVKHNF